MEELTLDEIVNLITANEEPEEVAQATEELRIRAYIMAKGGDRPSVPPKNP